MRASGPPPSRGVNLCVRFMLLSPRQYIGIEPLIQSTIEEGNAPFGVDDFCPMTPRSVRASSVTSAGTSLGGRRRIAPGAVPARCNQAINAHPLEKVKRAVS